jgi:hypothetical protein
MDFGVWLRSLGLEKYEVVLRDNEIDDAVLPKLTERSSHNEATVSVPVESIEVGKCFVTALGQIRGVTEMGAGTVKYVVLGKTVLAGDERTTSKQRFAVRTNPRPSRGRRSFLSHNLETGLRQHDAGDIILCGRTGHHQWDLDHQ